MVAPLDRIAILCAALLTAGGCKQAAPPQTTSPPTVAPTLWKEFSGTKAFEYVKAQVEIGPRPSGSAALEKARIHIISVLKEHGWDVERQDFEATPQPGRGALKFANLIARFPTQPGSTAPRDRQKVILGSHYDTKRMLGITFVGANDGGSSTGALLELARVAAQRPKLAEAMELAFFDGEEAVDQFGDAENGPDGLIGSRHYARDLRASGRAKQFRFALVWDMIGDKKLRLTLPSDSPPALAGGILTAGEQLGFQEHVGMFKSSILDDHVPLAVIARIPALDIIDFEYPVWHTSGDTLDQVSPDSLEKVGKITLWFLERELSK